MGPMGTPAGLTSSGAMGGYGGANDVSGGSPSGSSPNLLERLLPTIGSIGAYTVGGLLAPETGGLSLAAAAALSGGGGILGKLAENAATHQSLGNGVVGAGLTNAIGGGVGQGISGALGSLGGVAGDLGSSLASKEAAAGTEQAVSDAFPDAALNAADRTSMNFGKTLDLADQLGIDKTPQAFSDAAHVATGANGVLNGTLDAAVSSAGPVDMSGYSDLVNNAIQDNAGKLGGLGEASTGYRAASNAAQKLQQNLENVLQQTGYGGEGSVANAVDPEAALNMVRSVGSQASRFTNAAQGSDQAAESDVLNKVYNGLKNMVYNRPEVNDTISSLKLAPEDEQAILKAAGGNQQLAGYLTDTLNNANRASDILKPESDFVNMGKAGEKTLDYVNNVVGTGKSAQAAANAARLGLPEVPTSAHGLGAAAINTALKGGSKTLGIGSNVLGGLSKIAPIAALGAANLKNDEASPSNLPITSQLSNNVQGANVNPNQLPSNNIFGSLIPGSGVSSTYEPIAMQALLGMFDPQALNSGIEGSATAASNKLAQIQAAEAQLPQLQSLFQQAGGAQGPAGGLLSTLGGKLFGGAAGTYAPQAQQILSSISNESGVPSSSLVAPQLGQSPSSAQAALTNIQNLLAALGGQPAQ